MNLASIIVLCIVAGLFAISVAHVKRAKASKCNGNCAECAFRCDG